MSEMNVGDEEKYKCSFKMRSCVGGGKQENEICVSSQASQKDAHVLQASVQSTDKTSLLVDYYQFCLVECRPVEHIINSQCANPETVEVVERKKALEKAHSQAIAAMHDSQNFLRGKAKREIEPNLSLAKGEMLKARMQAQAAGDAARKAKEIYELVLRSAREASEEAGRATIAELRREAGEQAKKSLDARNAYEAAAHKNASNAAVGIAQVYKDALMKAQTVAGTWGLRASEYATAAAQRKTMSQDLATEAHNYDATKETTEAQNYILQAKQAMEQARQFAIESTKAHEQAQKIQDTVKWYTWAEQAAAANMLAKSMPPDVAPGPMPLLP